MNQSSATQKAPENHPSTELDKTEAAAWGAGGTKTRRMPTAGRLEGGGTYTFARAGRTG